MKTLNKVIANFTGTTRKDTLAGRDYLVAPMVMAVEGVMDGSNGALLYTAEELGRNVKSWNHKPVVVYHPSVGQSACDPSILSRRQIGIVMNARLENTENGPGIKAEAWLDSDRMNVVDERIPAAIENNEMMELSTGLFSNNEHTSGEWKGKKYDAIVRNMIADHLALLPDLKGACSIEDGAGFLRLNARPGAITLINNEMSHSNVRSLLNSWLQEKKKPTGDDEPYPFVEDVFDDFFIYEISAKFYKLDYKLTKDNTVEVSKNEPIEIIRKTEWVDLDGNFIGNLSSADSVTNKETPLLSPNMDELDDSKGTTAIIGDSRPEKEAPVKQTGKVEPLIAPVMNFEEN